MKKPHDDIDGLLYRALHELEAPVPPGDWELISSRLKKDTGKRGLSRGITLSVVLFFISAAGVAGLMWDHVSNDLTEKTTSAALMQSVRHEKIPSSDRYNQELPAHPGMPSAASVNHFKKTGDHGASKPGNTSFITPTENTNPGPADNKETGEKNYLERTAGARDNFLSIRIDPLGMGWLSSHLNPISNKHSGRWKIGVTLAEYSSNADYAVNPERSASTHRDYLQRVNASAGSRRYSRAGIELDYNAGKNLTVASGLAYEVLTEKVNYNFVNTEVPVIDGQSGRILGYVTLNDSVPTRYNGTNTAGYITLPLSIQKEIPFAPKWSAAVTVGGRLQMLAGANGTTLDPTTLELIPLTKEAMQRINVGYSVSAGINYYLGPLLSIGLQPGYERLLYANFKPGETLMLHDGRMGIIATAKLSIF